MSLENSPNSFWFLKKKHVFGILFLLNLSSGKSPNSTSECVYFLNFDFFLKKMSLEILNLWRKKYACRSFFGNKICVQKVFFVSKKTFARIFFFEFGDFLQTQVQNLQTHFFRKKKRNLRNTHTQRLSLENSPNSRVEFGDFPELRFKRNKIPKTCFFSQTKMSLENSPNSSAEFGEFSKLRFKRNFF